MFLLPQLAVTADAVNKAQKNLRRFKPKPTYFMHLNKIILLSLMACNIAIAQKKNFTLTGKTSNIKDGTYLYLRDLVNGGEIDSALVNSNSFKFDTELNESVVYTMLFTKDRQNFKEVWIENSKMTFDASNGDFKKAKITGSRNQRLFEEMQDYIYSNVENESKENIQKKKVSFIESHPNSVVSAYLLHGNRELNKEEAFILFANLSDEVKQNSLGKKIAKNLENNIATIGEEFPDFKVQNNKDEMKQISELTGKLTLLQFWSSTCSGSRMINPNLKGIYKKYNSDGFQIIGISRDRNKENWISAIEDDNLPWPQLSNLNSWEGEVFQAYGISSTPSNVLIDGQGIIIAKNVDIQDLENQVSKYLN